MSEFESSTVANDNIDIYSDPDIIIERLEPRNENELRVQLKGISVDNSVVNALRRIIMMDIPIYAFHRSNIFIDVERCKYMYNNDLIYNQIETLPIFDVPNYFDLEDPDTFMPTEVMKRIFGQFKKSNYEETEDIKSDSKKKLLKIDLSVNIKNNTNDFRYVTSHDLVLKIGGQISESYKIRDPIAIIVLKPGEEFSLKAEANLGISKMHAMYEATTNAIHEELSPTKFILWYETLEQLDKELIFSKACVILSKKLNNLREFILTNYDERDSDEIVEIELYGEDDTLGNLIATTLQKCFFVTKAAYAKPHPFISQILISYQLSEHAEIGPIQVLLDSIDYLVKLFTHLNDIWNE